MSENGNKQSEKAMVELTVTLPAEVAGIIANRAATSSQSESEIVAELLTEALIYHHGWQESALPQLLTPIVRMANALMVQAIDNGVDTLHIVPTQAGIQLRHLRNGELLTPGDAGRVSELPLHLHRPIFNRYEHMARPAYGTGIFHPETTEQGTIPVTHSGKSHDVGLRFLAREPDAVGETLELTFAGPLEES